MHETLFPQNSRFTINRKWNANTYHNFRKCEVVIIFQNDMIFMLLCLYLIFRFILSCNLLTQLICWWWFLLTFTFSLPFNIFHSNNCETSNKPLFVNCHSGVTSDFETLSPPHIIPRHFQNYLTLNLVKIDILGNYYRMTTPRSTKMEQ